MKLWLALLLGVSLYASESFITKEEYAKQLYHNPRGIGCHLCHGESGEGKTIANYEEKNIQKSFAGPAIKESDFDRFYHVLNKRNRGMPRYFLTDNEIKALYYYLQIINKKPENGSK